MTSKQELESDAATKGGAGKDKADSPNSGILKWYFSGEQTSKGHTSAELYAHARDILGLTYELAIVEYVVGIKIKDDEGRDASLYEKRALAKIILSGKSDYSDSQTLPAPETRAEEEPEIARVKGEAQRLDALERKLEQTTGALEGLKKETKEYVDEAIKKVYKDFNKVLSEIPEETEQYVKNALKEINDYFNKFTENIKSTFDRYNKVYEKLESDIEELEKKVGQVPSEGEVKDYVSKAVEKAVEEAVNKAVERAVKKVYDDLNKELGKISDETKNTFEGMNARLDEIYNNLKNLEKIQGAAQSYETELKAIQGEFAEIKNTFETGLSEIKSKVENYRQETKEWRKEIEEKLEGLLSSQEATPATPTPSTSPPSKPEYGVQPEAVQPEQKPEVPIVYKQEPKPRFFSKFYNAIKLERQEGETWSQYFKRKLGMPPTEPEVTEVKPAGIWERVKAFFEGIPYRKGIVEQKPEDIGVTEDWGAFVPEGEPEPEETKAEEPSSEYGVPPEKVLPEQKPEVPIVYEQEPKPGFFSKVYNAIKRKLGRTEEEYWGEEEDLGIPEEDVNGLLDKLSGEERQQKYEEPGATEVKPAEIVEKAWEGIEVKDLGAFVPEGTPEAVPIVGKRAEPEAPTEAEILEGFKAFFEGIPYRKGIVEQRPEDIGVKEDWGAFVTEEAPEPVETRAEEPSSEYGKEVPPEQKPEEVPPEEYGVPPEAVPVVGEGAGPEAPAEAEIWERFKAFFEIPYRKEDLGIPEEDVGEERRQEYKAHEPGAAEVKPAEIVEKAWEDIEVKDLGAFVPEGTPEVPIVYEQEPKPEAPTEAEKVPEGLNTSLADAFGWPKSGEGQPSETPLGDQELLGEPQVESATPKRATKANRKADKDSGATTKEGKKPKVPKEFNTSLADVFGWKEGGEE